MKCLKHGKKNLVYNLFCMNACLVCSRITERKYCSKKCYKNKDYSGNKTVQCSFCPQKIKGITQKRDIHRCHFCKQKERKRRYEEKKLSGVGK